LSVVLPEQVDQTSLEEDLGGLGHAVDKCMQRAAAAAAASVVVGVLTQHHMGDPTFTQHANRALGQADSQTLLLVFSTFTLL
jgi:hypothetical protein